MCSGNGCIDQFFYFITLFLITSIREPNNYVFIEDLCKTIMLIINTIT